MHLDLETENDNYDESRGEQIALNTDGDKGATATDSTFRSGRMDVQVMMKFIINSFIYLIYKTRHSIVY